MKKLIIAALAAATIAMAVPSTAVAAQQRGGCIGGIIGCCFGIRAAGDYNEGKDLHFMEWGRLLPIVNIYVSICNFVDGYNGKTSTDLRNQYGATYF